MLRDASHTLKRGDPAPEFELPTAASSMVRLADFRGRCVVLVFIRGTWCPNCSKQMDQFDAAFDDFKTRGLQPVFIAAQRRDGWFRGKEFIEKKRYPFPLLFDEKRETSRAYGVHQALGIDTVNLARRSVFLIDGGGVIRWIAISPHQWEAPGVAEIFAAVDACGACGIKANPEGN